MWNGGVRVAIRDDAGRILMVKQHHENKDIWMLPGGAIEKDENSEQAAIREVLEETGIEIEVERLLWHVEEVSGKRGQRFVNFFLARLIGGELVLGEDPEFDKEGQVLRETAFLSKEQIEALEIVYPEFIKTELWEEIDRRDIKNPVFRVRL